MKKIKKILAPTDLSELSKVGVRYALEMAESEGAEVVVFYVSDYAEALPSSFTEQVSIHPRFETVDKFINNHKKKIHEFLVKNFSDLVTKVKVHPEADVGVDYKKIVERAEKECADIIVMSTHGRTGFGHMLIGSVTEQVVRRSGCPVLSVRATNGG